MNWASRCSCRDGRGQRWQSSRASRKSRRCWSGWRWHCTTSAVPRRRRRLSRVSSRPRESGSFSTSSHFYWRASSHWHAWRGDANAAFAALEEWLQPTLSERSPPHWLDFALSLRSAMYTRIHGDPRWEELLQKQGLGAERLDAIEFTLHPSA